MNYELGSGEERVRETAKIAALTRRWESVVTQHLWSTHRLSSWLQLKIKYKEPEACATI